MSDEERQIQVACGRHLFPLSFRLRKAPNYDRVCEKPAGHKEGVCTAELSSHCTLLNVPPLWRQVVYFGRWWKHFRLINGRWGKWSSRRYAFTRVWPYRCWPRKRGMVGWIEERDGSRRYYTHPMKNITNSTSHAG